MMTDMYFWRNFCSNVIKTTEATFNLYVPPNYIMQTQRKPDTESLSQNENER